MYNDILLDLKTLELLQKFSELQDHLSVILLSIQKPPVQDVIFDFLSNNSSFY